MNCLPESWRAAQNYLSSETHPLMMLITVSYVQFDSYHQKWLIIAMLLMDIVRKMSLHFSHTLKILTYEHYGLMAHNLLLMLYMSPLYIMLVLSWHAWWEYWIVLWKGSNLKTYTSWFAASLWSCLCLPAWAPYVMPSQLWHLGYWHPQTSKGPIAIKACSLGEPVPLKKERDTWA